MFSFIQPVIYWLDYCSIALYELMLVSGDKKNFKKHGPSLKDLRKFDKEYI